MEQVVLAPGEERAAPGESELIQRIVDLSLDLLDTKSRPVRRGQHPKHYGCVKAEFIVEPGLPPELCHGVFREAGSFPALIRFSSGRELDDRKGDIHGMAIKLLGVAGEKVLEAERNERTQDFLLADNPVFFVRDLADYVPFSQDVFNAKNSLFGRLVFLCKLIFSWNYKWKLLKAALRKKPDSPLRIQYWSQTPYRLGTAAVKYSARPDLALTPAPPPSDSMEKLREAMAAHLSGREARFDFLVQVQTDPATMPVENPTIAWDEGASPFRKVASIRIPAQTFETPEQMTFCENLSYTPWHALPEHRPLGGINRARKIVYEALSKRRHEMNQVARREPGVEDIPAAP